MKARQAADERGVTRIALVLALCTVTLGVASAAWAIQTATSARGIPDRTLQVAAAPQPAATTTATPHATATPTTRHRPTPQARPTARATSLRPSVRSSQSASTHLSPRATAAPKPLVVASIGVGVEGQHDASEGSNSADD